MHQLENEAAPVSGISQSLFPMTSPTVKFSAASATHTCIAPEESDNNSLWTVLVKRLLFAVLVHRKETENVHRMKLLTDNRQPT